MSFIDVAPLDTISIDAIFFVFSLGVISLRFHCRVIFTPSCRLLSFLRHFAAVSFIIGC